MQTLGTPLSMLTLPGVVSASLGLALLPLLGCLTDGGSQPHRRKKPLVVGAFCVAVLGLTLTLGGTALHTWETAVAASSLRPQQHLSGKGSSIGSTTSKQNAVFSAPPRPLGELYGSASPVGQVNTTGAEDTAVLTTLHSGTEDPFGEEALPSPVPSAQVEHVATIRASRTTQREGLSRESNPSVRVAYPASLPFVQINAQANSHEGEAPLVYIIPGQVEELAVTSPGLSPFADGVGDWDGGNVEHFGNGSSRNLHTEVTGLATVDSSSVGVLTQMTHLNRLPVVGSESVSDVSPDNFTTPIRRMDVSRPPTLDSEEVEASTESTSAQFRGVHSKVLGLPVAALLAMAGFVFMDLGFDLTNSAVKTCMLTHSVPADHVSLLVTSVFMSALGGCVTSVSGLLDLSSLLPGV